MIKGHSQSSLTVERVSPLRSARRYGRSCKLDFRGSRIVGHDIRYKAHVRSPLAKRAGLNCFRVDDTASKACARDLHSSGETWKNRHCSRLRNALPVPNIRIKQQQRGHPGDVLLRTACPFRLLRSRASTLLSCRFGIASIGAGTGFLPSTM